MKLESVLKKNLFYILLFVGLIFISSKAIPFSLYIGKTVSYQPTITETVAEQGARCQSGAFGLSIINIPSSISTANIESTYTIVSVDSPVNSGWLGSTTSSSTVTILPGGRLDIGSNNPAGAVICSKGGNCDSSGLDGYCRETHIVNFVVPTPIVSSPTPTPTVIFPSTPMPTPEIIIQPVPVPPVNTPMPAPVTKWYISNGQCVSTTTPSLVSASLYTSFGQCENARGATDITVYIGILVVAIIGFLVLKKIKIGR